MFSAVALSGQSVGMWKRAAVANPHRATRISRGPVAARADLSGALFMLAERSGEVEAPIGAIVVGAVVVTAVGLGSTYFFKSGFEASEGIKERDAATFNKKRPPPPKPTKRR